jgi:hypothetical protein
LLHGYFVCTKMIWHLEVLKDKSVDH